MGSAAGGPLTAKTIPLPDNEPCQSCTLWAMTSRISVQAEGDVLIRAVIVEIEKMSARLMERSGISHAMGLNSYSLIWQ